MTRGKRTCKILKEIRQQIAEKNDIEYVTSECHFRGECEGTCPKCEEELQYLENELQKRKQLGKAVAIAGISLGIVGTFSDCTTCYPQVDMPIIASNTVTSVKDSVITVFDYTQKQGTGTVKGKVVEEDGKTPADFSTVRLMQDNQMVLGVITDEKGNFSLSPARVGKYDIRITNVDYNEYIIKGFEIEEYIVKDIGKVRLEASGTLTTGIVVTAGRPPMFKRKSKR